MGLKTYRELEAWKKAMMLTEEAYRISRSFPEEERFGLTSQLRRAAVSVPANIAEGYGRSHRGDYLHHLSIARGSLAEVETLLTLSVRLNYADREEAVSVWESAQQTGRLLNGLIASLRNQQPGGEASSR